jgi:adenylate cyclase
VAGGIFARGWRSIREAGPRRLALTALLLVAALLLARFSWYLPVTEEAEHSLYDLRSFVLAEEAAQDERIVLVVYNDQTLINARKRSPLDRGLLSEALRNLDAMGAKAIGIDILFDQPQDEDEELIATLRSMRTPVSVAYAETGVNVDDIVFEQQQYLEQVLSSLEGSRAHPASIMLDNSFGVTRLWPRILPQLPPVLGRAMLTAANEGSSTLPGYEGAIRYRRATDESMGLFSSLPIDTFANPEIVPHLAPAIEGRYVLIGGDIVDYDRVETSLTAVTGRVPPGIEVHAEMIGQMLDDARLPKPPPAALWALALVVVGSAALTGLVELRSLKIYPLLALQFAASSARRSCSTRKASTRTACLPSAGFSVGSSHLPP